MFLDKINLINFKCFQKQEVRLSKLTILLGANSSGKSSLIHAILGAIQSDSFPFLFSPNGNYVNMGDFRSISHRHRSSKKIGIFFCFSDEAQIDTMTIGGEFIGSSSSRMPTLDSAIFEDPEFKLHVVKNERYKAQWSYTQNKKGRVKGFPKAQDVKGVIRAMNRLLPPEIVKGWKTKKGKESGKLLRFIAKPEPSGTFLFSDPVEFDSIASKNAVLELMPHIAAVSNTLPHFARKFNYIGSFREEPSRTYYQVSKSNLKVGPGGENYINQLAVWEQLNSPQFGKLKAYLRKLKVLSELKTKRMTGGRFEISVKPFTNSVPASLADVGFGLSQLLPILVADLQLPKGSSLAISQPEIHLHPSVQADLADYFTERTRQDNKRYIIETHSEYLLNRLRLLVAEKKLKPEDLSILYLRPDGPSTKCFNIVFSRDGRIEGAPKDFFQTYMHDVMNIAMKATK